MDLLKTMDTEMYPSDETYEQVKNFKGDALELLAAIKPKI